MQMDRTASNPLFGDRGNAPIPEEYKSKGPRPPAAPPSAPPPSTEDAEAHAAFEKARQAAAKKREAAGRPLSLRFFLPRMPSSHRENSDHVPDSLEGATNAHDESKRTSFMNLKRFLPRAPSMEPPPEIDEAKEREFEEHKERAKKQREERERNFALGAVLTSSPLAKAMSRSRSFFSTEPPELHAQAGGFDDGEKIMDAKGEDPVPVFKSRRERCWYEIRHRHAIERAMMAGFAVCLLWLTSLAVSRAIVSRYIIGPPLERVMGSIECATNRTVEESDFYELCATRRSDECDADFLRELNNEALRINVSLAYNRVVLAGIRDDRANCSDRFGEVILMLDFLINNRSQPLEPGYTVANFSSNPNCSSVRKTLDDQLAAIRAQKKAEDFQYVADEEVLSVYDQYRRRAAYDREYLLTSTANLSAGGDALNELVTDPRAFFSNMSVHRDRMMACSTESGIYNGVSCPPENLPTLMQKVNIARANLITQYENQVASVNAYIINMEEQYRPLMNFYLAFRDAMQRVAGLKAALDGSANDNGGNGGGLAAFGWADIPDPSIGNPNMPSVSSFSSGVGTTDGANNVNKQNQQSMVAANDATERQMNASANATKEGQTSWQSGFLSDYNPPPYNVDENAAAWAQTSSEYLPDVQQDLALVARRVGPPRRPEFGPTNDTEGSERKATELLKDHEFNPLKLYAYDDISPEVMLSQWNSILNIAYAMDYVYRVLRTLSIIKTYISVSAVLAPPADVRVKGTAPKGVAMRTRRNPDQALARLLTHPAMNLLLVLIFLGVVIAAFLTIYLPFFNAYVAGCIRGNLGEGGAYDGEGFRRNGTMITRNAATVAFQAATGDGDEVTSTFIDRINVARELKCSENEDRTLRQLKTDRQEYDFNVAKTSDLLTSVVAFQQCINAPAVEAFLNSTDKLQATNGTSSSFVNSLFHPTCRPGNGTLQFKMFDCQKIHVCDPKCTGPPEAELNLVTFNAGCLGEHYAHAAILGTAFSVLAFILMNLSRWTLLRGIRRVFLDHFAIGEYSYLASTDEFGQTQYPEKVTEEGLPFKDVLRDELHDTIKKFKRSGYLICLLAVSLNLPWLIGLSEFSKNLQFQLDGNEESLSNCPRSAPPVF